MATLVILVDQVLKAYLYDISKKLSAAHLKTTSPFLEYPHSIEDNKTLTEELANTISSAALSINPSKSKAAVLQPLINESFGEVSKVLTSLGSFSTQLQKEFNQAHHAMNDFVNRLDQVSLNTSPENA